VNGTAGAFITGTSAGSRSTHSGLADINVLARGASNAKWHSGCLAPDRCVESICDWLIRGPLFLRRPNSVEADTLVCLSWQRTGGRQECPPYGRLDEISSHGPDGGLRAIRDTDFSQNVLDVLFYRLVADAQRLRDFFVSEAECELFEDFAFALG
jgi:hypothetical protein